MGESLVAFADWARTKYLPELMNFSATDLASQNLWDQMSGVPVKQLAAMVQEVVGQVISTERLQIQALAYDTTDFCTHIASTNLLAKLLARFHDRQGSHDLRQIGLAVVVDQKTHLPLAHSLYEGARSDMRRDAEFLNPRRKRPRALSGTPAQMTIVIATGASSQQNLDGIMHYVTAIRTAQQTALLAEAAVQLTDVQLSNGATVRACRSRRRMFGQQRELVVFNPKSRDGQKSPGVSGNGLNPRLTAEAAKQRLENTRGRQYRRFLLCNQLEADREPDRRICIWSNCEEYQLLTTRYFGLRILIADRGPSRADPALRDMKDPLLPSARRQFHWTDQRLHFRDFDGITVYHMVAVLLDAQRSKLHFGVVPADSLRNRPCCNTAG